MLKLHRLAPLIVGRQDSDPASTKSSQWPILHEPHRRTLDEPTSALDPLVAEEILTLLRKLQRELGLSYILITDDLDVVHRIAHRTAVMLQGQFVAFDTTDKIFENPEHPYTHKLITAVPEMRVDWLDEVLAKRQKAAA